MPIIGTCVRYADEFTLVNPRIVPSVLTRLNPYGESYITDRDCERRTQK